MNTHFDYDQAFSRNIGWVTEAEQQLLKTRRVAIAGLGGVGGSHLLTLTRLGVGAFNLSDFDRFGIENFNRQAGASLTSVDKPKLDTLVKRALDINPELDIRTFPEGVSEDNVDAFLQDVDVYVDGLDFFALDARQSVFAACARLSIPATTAAPLGMGTALLNFLPGKMTFEEYFRLSGVSEAEQYLRFFVGLAPSRLHASYLVDPRRIDLPGKKGPSTAMGCELCAGAAASQVLKLLLKRGKVVAAPWALHFDAYNNQLAKTWRPGGNNHPLQKLAIAIGKKQLLQRITPPEPTTPYPVTSPAEKVLNLARWAPSGDNTQPWRFELIDDNQFVVHGSDTRDSVVYDLDGRASQLAIGGLLESIEIAASSLELKAIVHRRTNLPDQTPTFDVKLDAADTDQAPSELAPYLRIRCVQRRAMSTRPITPKEKAKLEENLPDGYSVVWFEGWSGRWQATKLMFANAKVRLTMPEAYKVHSHIVEWGQQFSNDKIPEQAVGIDAVTGKMMHWAMDSWERVRFMNRYMMGTLAPRLQLDLIPGLKCAAHFAIVAPTPPTDLEDYLQGGAAMQRFWLTAAKLGLSLQPEMTPLIFARFLRNGTQFTQTTEVERLARKCEQSFSRLMAGNAESAVFLGRIGESPLPISRSLRLDLADLMIPATTLEQQPAERRAG